MPFRSKAQQRYFYANRQKLEAQGVDVSEWAKETDFEKLPEKVSALKIPHGALIGADLAGLGILAVPSLYHVVTGEHMDERYADAAELGGLGILGASQIPHLTGHVKEASLTTVDTTAQTELTHGDDVRQPLLRNPYLPSDPMRAQDYENGYEHAMSLGHRGIVSYNLQSANNAPVAWREGFAEGASKLGRADLAQQLRVGGAKVAEQLTPEGLMSLSEDPGDVELRPGVLFDVDGTLVDAGAYKGGLDAQTLRPGVLERLLGLAHTGLRLAAVTNRSVYDASQTVETVAAMNADVMAKTGGTLRDVYFMSHGPTQFHKPSGAMLRFAMARERIDPAQCLYVGDSEDDKNAAADAGILFVPADQFFAPRRA